MLYHLLFALRGELSLLNVTRYITFRTAVASLTALLLVLVLGPGVSVGGGGFDTVPATRTGYDTGRKRAVATLASSASRVW